MPLLRVTPPPGLVPSSPERLSERLPIETHAKVGARLGGAAFPYEVHLSHGRPRNQGRASTCGANSLAKGIWEILGFDPSDHDLYVLAGQIERDSRDDGRCLLDYLEVARTVGLSPYRGPSPDGRYSDTWTAEDVADMTPPVEPNVCLPPPAEALALAGQHLIDLGRHSIDPRSPDLANQLRATLATGHTIYGGWRVGSAFEGLQPGQIAEPDPDTDPTGGGHALRIVGYWTLPDGAVVPEIENTWDLWDEAGNCRASLAFVASAWELHVLEPVKVSPSLLDRAAAFLRGVVA